MQNRPHTTIPTSVLIFVVLTYPPLDVLWRVDMKEKQALRSILPSPFDSGGETGGPVPPDNGSFDTQTTSTPASSNSGPTNATPYVSRQSPNKSPKKKRQRIGTQVACDSCRDRKARVSNSLRHSPSEGDLSPLPTLPFQLVGLPTGSRLSKLLTTWLTSTIV